MSITTRRAAGTRSFARATSSATTRLIRAGLLGSTALVAVGLAATGAMAQTTVVNPTGGGTITRVGGSNPTVTNQTATGGGLQITNVTQSTGLTVNGVTINQTVTGPTTNALDIRGSTSGLNSTGVAFDGVNTLTTTVSGGAAYFQQTNANEGVSFLSSGSTLTGSYGVWLNAPGGYLDFNSAGQGQSFIANGTAIAGLNAISAINNNLQLGTSTFTGFATGVNATNLYGSSLTSTGGSINATSTGIRLDATGGASTVNSQTAITAPIGINSTNTNGATITTSGGGTINAHVAGVGTGIIASSSGGTTLDPFTINVGAAIGDITAFATGVTASTTGSSTNIINISTTAAITATSRGISVTAGTFGNTGTFNLGANVTGATGVYTNVGNYAVNVASGVTVTSTGNGATDAALYLINGTNTVTNDGALTASGTSSHGVHFSSDGLVTNTATGTITGSTGIWYQNLASVNNAGTITGTGSTGTAGVYGSSGASVTNTGTITGFDGVYSGGNPTTHNNTGGTITGVSHGYNVTGGRLTLTNTGVINTAGGTGGAGLSGLRLATSLASVNTVTNSGTITGGGDATHGFGVEVEDGALTLNNLSGGVITGGIGAIRLASDDLATLNLNAGSTVTGDIVSSNTGARTVNLAGTLAGDYANAAASGVVTFTLASTGSMQAATFGSANDTFTWQGGTIGGVINAGGGTGDIFNSALGAGNAGSLSLGNLTGFETYNHQSGTLTLTGSRLTGPGWAVTSGASITLDGALTTTTGTGTALTINGNTSGSVVQILSGATIGGFSGLFFNGGPAATFNNAGTISVSSRGLNTNGQTAMTNTGTIASSGEIGISTGFSVASLTNSGTVSGGSTSAGISSQYSAMSITNQAGGFITGGSTGILGGTTGFGGLLTINNASGAGITGATAIVTAGNAGISLTNTGQIVGSTNAINAGGSGAVTITNNVGGVIATGTLASAGATYVAGGTGSAITTSGSATIVNNGTINGNSFGAFSNGGLLTVTNRGSISVGNGGDAVVAVGTANVLNSGTITADLYSAVNVLGGGTVVNAAGGTLTGGTEATFGEAVQFLSGTASFTNYGSASSAIGRGVFVAGSATTTINLHAGSMTGSILTGSGNDTLSIFSGRGTAGAASVDAPSGITLQNAGTLAAASFGTIDLGAGTNTLNLRGTGDGSAANGTGGSFGLGGAVGVSTLAKLDTGTWTLTGNGSGITTINAGTGTPGGLLIFNGSNLTAGIYVNGATVRAGSTAAFGTGTLHMIDPTAEFAATGSYANDISLEVVNGQQAADPTILRNTSGGTITLSGRIYETAGVGGANQYVTFDGAGTTILSNATNSWGGVTTINAGTTLQGGTGTISGGSIANAGALVFSQTIDGTFATAISGAGALQVNSASQAVTLGGVNTYSGTTSVLAGTLIASGGAAIGDTSAVTIASGATLQLANNETIGGLSGTGIARVLGNTLTLGGNDASTTFSGTITDQTPVAFIGSWTVSDGPHWSTNPPTYTGQEAAALLFGGSAAAYRLSTAGAGTGTINDLAWYNRYGNSVYLEAVADFRIDTGTSGYNAQGDTSAYVGDHTGTPMVNYAFTGGVALGGGLTKTGTGTLTLSGTNTYTGVTAINGGRLVVQNGTAISDLGTVNILSTGAFTVADSETVGNLTGAGATTVAAGQTLTVGAATGAYTGDVDGAGAFAITGTGTYALGGDFTNDGGILVSTLTTRTLTFDAGSSVTAVGTGVTGSGAGALTLTNAGEITGTGHGIYSSAGLDLTNSGTVLQTTGGGSAVTLANGGTVLNTADGLIAGFDVGLVLGSGAATVTNAGSITGAANDAIYAGGAVTLINTGNIHSDVYAGVRVVAGGSVTNSGILTGGSIAGQGYGVRVNTAASTLITNQSGGLISGGVGSILLGGAGNATIDLQSGSTTTGVILSTGSGANAVTIAGALNGAYNAASGSGSDSLTLASTGSMTTASLGAGNDSFLYQGGTFSGLIDAGTGAGDVFRSVLGTGSASISLNNLTNFESYTQESGSLTLTGSRTGGPGWQLLGGSLTLNGSLTNTGVDGAGVPTHGVAVTGANATVNVGAGSVLWAQAQNAVQVGFVDNFTLNNSGTLGGGTTGGSGVRLNRSATISNDAGGLITSASDTAGATGISNSGAGVVVNNASGATITGNYAGIHNVFGIESTAPGLVVNNSGLITSFGADAAAIRTDSGTLTVNNNADGVITGQTQGILNAAGTLTVTNAGTITGTTNDGITSFDTLTLTNTGILSSDVFSGVALAGGGSVTNAGAITGGVNSTWGFGIQNASGSGLVTITNQSGGVIGGGTGSILLNGTGDTTINLLDGSTTNGQILSTAGGTHTVHISGDLNGTYDASTGSGIDILTLVSTGSMTSADLGAGDDMFSYYGGTISGLVDGGLGTDSLFADFGAGQAFNVSLANFVNFETIGLISGDLTLTGPSGSPDAVIYAGNGTPGLGTVTFTNTQSNTGDIYVNGADIRASTAGAFGTGTIHLIDPTVFYGATGAYANNISLEVQTPAAGDPSTLSADAGVLATLTGSITQGAGAGVDPLQPLVIAGAGTIILTNTANSWAGTTTINAGATLQGSVETVSGTDLSVNGTLRYVQPDSATLSQDASGTGNIVVSGLGAGETFTVASTLNMATVGLTVSDTSGLSVTGSVIGAGGTAILLNNTGAPGTSVLTNAGLISGARGLQGFGVLDLTNSGTITSTGTTGYAVIANQAATVLNTASGTIGAAYAGLFMSGTASVTNAGLIQGGNTAIVLFGATSSLTNTGTISNTGSSGFAAVYGTGNTVTIDNSGTIGIPGTTSTGVFLVGNDVSVTNQSGGTIAGSNYGIYLTGAGSTIDLQVGSTTGSIEAYNSTGSNTVTLAGQLNGFYDGSDTGSDLVTLSGTVTQGLFLSGGDDTLSLDTAASFGGQLNGGAGTDALTLTGSGAGALNTGLVTGFESRSVEGGVWSLGGIDGQAASWTVNVGGLVLGGGSSVNNLAGITLAGGTTLAVTNSETIGSLSGSGSTSVASGQTLAVGGDGTTATYSGVISGAGGFATVGGTTVLSGANSYAGATLIQAGTLRLGASNVLSDATTLSVSTGATLDMQAFNDTVGLALLNGTLAGTGTLTAAQYQLNGATINANLGAGSLFNLGGTSVLNGTAAAGSVSVQAGTLRLGASDRLADTATVSVSTGATFDVNSRFDTIGALYGTGTVAISAGRLTFGGADSAFGGTLSGAGSLVHTGGVFNLSGNHSLQSLGSTGGELRFVGATTGNVAISGGSLAGAATIGGALTVSNGATLSPGLVGQNNGLGNFTVGSLGLNGGTLALDVLGTAGGNLTDRLTITGTATLTGGVLAPVFVGPASGYGFATRYQFLTAGQLVGTFSNGAAFTAAPAQSGLFWRVRYDLAPNAAVLELRNQINFDLGGNGSGNQNAVAQALSGGQLQASDDWSGVLELLSSLTPPQRQAAFNSMSGEALADMSSSMLAANDAFTNAVRDTGSNPARSNSPLGFASAFNFVGARDGASAMVTDVLDAFDPSAAAGPGRGGWVSVLTSDIDLEGQTGQADLQTRLNGFVGGYSAETGPFVVGVAGGATRVEGEVAMRASSYESDLLHAAGYVRYDNGRWSSDLTASVYGGEIDSRRTVSAGAFTGQALGKTHGEGQSVSLSIARRYADDTGGAVSIGVMETVSRSTVDAFTETGAGGLSLEFADQERNWQTTQLTLRRTQDYRLGAQPMRVYGGLGLLYTTGDRDAAGAMRFSGAAAGFGGFAVEGAEADALAGTAEFGVEYTPRDGLTLSTGFRTVISERLNDNQVGARMSIAW